MSKFKKVVVVGLLALSLSAPVLGQMLEESQQFSVNWNSVPNGGSGKP